MIFSGKYVVKSTHNSKHNFLFIKKTFEINGFFWQRIEGVVLMNLNIWLTGNIKSNLVK